jgi:hypothetical protein
MEMMWQFMMQRQQRFMLMQQQQQQQQQLLLMQQLVNRGNQNSDDDSSSDHDNCINVDSDSSTDIGYEMDIGDTDMDADMNAAEDNDR